ncbi:zinc ABC transporter substrate-binding protein [Palleronia sp. KMU-117]|uniref:zinc ABC transporter substrate-binding protein n=1 Tax=Palleronia sp. KMU-117 TaxID=3434108 RepID=UPI003D70B2B0
MRVPVRHSLLAAIPAALLCSAAWAEVPAVAADIAPIHGLVARVMQGVGTPDLVIRHGASPHDYSLRPSEAAALEQADLVFWVGAPLTPWLADTIATLAGDARVVALLEAPGTITLTYREGATFEDHDHADHADHGGHDDHGHGDHAHDHLGVDPHAWLDPENARIWLDVIAAELSSRDPDNAAIYAANAAAGHAEIDAAAAEVAAAVAPLAEAGFVVFHDAYHYFEARFGLAAAGAITLGDATDPSPARVAEIRDAIAETGVACVFSEPQFDPGLVAAVLEGASAKTAVIDPLGAELTPGPGFYPALLTALGASMAGCL